MIDIANMLIGGGVGVALILVVHLTKRNPIRPEICKLIMAINAIEWCFKSYESSERGSIFHSDTDKYYQLTFSECAFKVYENRRIWLGADITSRFSRKEVGAILAAAKQQYQKAEQKFIDSRFQLVMEIS